MTSDDDQRSQLLARLAADVRRYRTLRYRQYFLAVVDAIRTGEPVNYAEAPHWSTAGTFWEELSRVKGKVKIDGVREDTQAQERS